MIYLAFPGTGKTPLAKAEPEKYYDLDFNDLRNKFGKKLPDEELFFAYRELAWAAERAGYIVLINEPRALDGHFTADRMFLPKEWKWSMKKLGIDAYTCVNYILDWSVIAGRLHIPITKLNCGLDRYLSKK